MYILYCIADLFVFIFFFNLFQANAAKIGVLHDQITKLLRKLLGKFVQVKCITSCKDICDVKYNDRENQLSNDLIAVGPKNRTYLVDYSDDLKEETETKFFR